MRSTMKILVLSGLIITTSAWTMEPADPTRPPTPLEIQAFLSGSTSAEEAPTRHWELQSILISDTRRVAIINGRRVGEGDWIDAAEIQSIEPGKVVLLYRSEPVVLTLTSRRGDYHNE